MLCGGPGRAQVQGQGETLDAAAIINILIITEVEMPYLTHTRLL